MIIDFIQGYGRQWEMHEKEDVDTLSEWAKSVSSLLKIKIKNSMG